MSNHSDGSIEVKPAKLPPLPEDLAQSLRILADIVQILNIDEISFLSYSTALSWLMDQSSSLSVSLDRLKSAEEELDDHLAQIKHESGLLKHWTEPFTINGEIQSIEGSDAIGRRREALVKKAKEYHKELESILKAMPQSPRVTVMHLQKQQAKNRLLEQQIQAKRSKIKAFQGLPPNLDLARHELRNARAEQMKLIQLRERLLKRMAEDIA